MRQPYVCHYVKIRPRRSILVMLLLSLWPSISFGQPNTESVDTELLKMQSGAIDKQWVTEKLGNSLPMQSVFVDEQGEKLQLADFIDRPTLILPIYFYCPSTCSKNLANLAVSLNRLTFSAEKDYRVIALSFSDTETADNARRAKNNYLKLVYDDFPEKQWKFLTGNAEDIAQVTDNMGFRFRRMADGTFIHPSALIVVDEKGTIIRYVYGSFISGDIDLGIAAAQKGEPTLSVKRMLDFCFNYDPNDNTGLFRYVKMSVLLFFTVGIASIFFIFRRKKKG